MFRFLNIVKLFTFVLFFWPITVSSVSINYAYTILYMRGVYVLRTVPMWIKLYVLYCFLSYIIGLLIYQKFSYLGEWDYLLRSSIGFIIFLAPVCLVFVKLKLDLDSIKSNLIFVSVLYSLWSIYNIKTHDMGLSDPYKIKNDLTAYVDGWPQGFSSIIVFSIFLVLEKVSTVKGPHKTFSIIIFLLLLSIVYLTYTRTAYIATFLGFLIFSMKMNKKMMAYILICILSISVLTWFMPLIHIGLDSVINRTLEIFSNLISGNTVIDSSAGLRLYYWDSQIELLLKGSILTGTGFSGVSLFFPDIGSSHSQYMDVFFRSGVIGLFFYLYMLVFILKFYSNKDWYIFCGFFSVIIFGLFQETMKLSYMGLLMGLLLYCAVSEKHRLKR